MTKTHPTHCIYPHPWDVVVRAYLRRYPTHPRVPVLLSSEVLSDELLLPSMPPTPYPQHAGHDIPVRGTRRIVRRCRVAIEMPTLVKKTFGVTDGIFLHTTLIDADNKEMRVESQNQSWAEKITIGDVTVFRACPPGTSAPVLPLPHNFDQQRRNAPTLQGLAAVKVTEACDYTEFEQQAFLELPKIPLAKTIEKHCLQIYMKNTMCARMLDMLFCDDVLREQLDLPKLPSVAPFPGEQNDGGETKKLIRAESEPAITQQALIPSA
ncbi:uncharacterized protein VTP21DRAFT_9936 [Calcarisporiella thermophila]|uniref:uncharacterized protein n=1 Tax=Calcarisporiella thermophila TaxID=911321 RepID=UPI0037447C99